MYIGEQYEEPTSISLGISDKIYSAKYINIKE